MTLGPRMSEELNRALGALLSADPELYLLGEDITDPYGGAFKITRGLSGRYPAQVLGTPISEGGLVGVANGLALAGNRVIAEIMFGDFIGLAFDQLVNLSAKSVSMYGAPVPVPVIVRCPVGAGRGYGPTHSQHPGKHLVGVPDLTLAELSPFHDPLPVLQGLLHRGTPAVFFEDKILYTERAYAGGAVDDVFRFALLDGPLGWASVFAGPPAGAECVIIAPGGLAHRALAAARELLIRSEITSQILVPSQLYPFDLDPVLPILADAALVCIAEDGPPGGTWGETLARAVYERLWPRLRRPIAFAQAAPAVIPAAVHLEQEVIVGAGLIRRVVEEAIA
jgi:pyruvate/2-oxoglutarate/acetoin dehydrogenase E1 component